MIGLSLSLCVFDIASGYVKYDDVEKIIAGTKIESESDLEEVLDHYSQVLWADFPEKACEIARRLWNENKVDQPRIHGLDHTLNLHLRWIDGDGYLMALDRNNNLIRAEKANEANGEPNRLDG
jgi:hypothetical protein